MWSFQYHILFILKTDLVHFAVDICGGFYASETVQYRHLGFICDISKNKFGFLKVEAVKSMKENMHFFGFALLVIFDDRNSLNKSHMLWGYQRGNQSSYMEEEQKVKSEE